MKIEQLQPLVIQWAKDKGILNKATPLTQITKTQEELDETREALFWQSKGFDTYTNSKGILCNTKEEIKDGFGDILVTLIIGAEMQGLSLDECLEASYNVISKRTGVMKNGYFIRDK